MLKEATIEQFLNDWSAAAQKVMDDLNKPQKPKNPSISSSISFTEKETSRMNPIFAYSFEERGRIAHVTKQKTENGQFMYTIKYILDCYNITVTHSKLRKAKKAFISKTWEAVQ